MLIIRPLNQADLENLFELLQDSGHGLTNLPKDRKVLTEKIATSTESFAQTNKKPQGELYLFGLEATHLKKIIGVCGIISKIGGFEPYYFYSIHSEKNYSKLIDSENTISTMNLEKIHSGPAEICSLFLSPKHRSSHAGRFLSLSRFLFMAEHPEYFEDEVIAEMRGKVDDNGESPFWNAVGSKFINLTFLEADFLTLKSKSFIEDLFPKHPILIDLLPNEAKDVIGEVHPNTIGARRILEKEGFSYKNRVGILEPGPLLEANTKEIRVFKESKILSVSEIQLDDQDFSEELFLVANTKKNERFIMGLSRIKIKDSQVTLNKQTALSIGVSEGDKVRISSLIPSKVARQLEL